jgi:uncharacterized repeat protein (TIGR01451 family)
MSTTKSESLVLVSKQNGFVIIPAATPLTRLNYFDGKFLRASDLKAEQNYLRQIVAQSNQAGGAGVAHGFDLTLGGGDNLEIGPGLAIDPSGRVLLLPQGTTIGVQELIDKSRDLQRLFGGASVVRAGTFERCELDDGPLTGATAASNLFLIVISPAEALCGEEDVYGKLCEEACATSTDRPFAVEGLTVRAIPLVLQTPLPSPKVVALTQAHLRSRVASAYFEDERRRVASLISAFGLQQETWCLGSDAAGGSGVPIGVIARSGPTTVFLDPWIARRERIDAPAKRYWQWRMMMRPWDVFLAQVLQFQCQLHDLFRKAPVPGDVDPCGGARGALRDAADTISELRQFYQAATQRFLTLNVNPDEFAFQGGSSKLTSIHDRLVSVGQALGQLATDRFLINGGIIELPSAGYLPVAPGAAAATINQQVRRLMGEGVDLRFCVVRPDYVAHALEEAQHMERISLLQGLDDPRNKPEVDILVPNGEILEQKQLSPGNGFVANVDLNRVLFSQRNAAGGADDAQALTVNFRGAARTETLAGGGGAVYLSCDHEDRFSPQVVRGDVAAGRATTTPPATTPGVANPAASPAFTINLNNAAAIGVVPRVGLFISLRCENNAFSLGRGDTTNLNARAIIAATNRDVPLFDLELNGVFQVTDVARTTGTARSVTGVIKNAQFSFRSDSTGTGAGPVTQSVDLGIKATITAGSAIEIILSHEQSVLSLSADWGQQPLEVSAEIALGARGGADGIAVRRQTILAHADLKEDADVLSATNAAHVQALASLEVIAKALSDAIFADAKARLLFPPPPKPTDELLVRGTLDWVLFHRRRNKRCSAEILQPVAPPREYQVYHLAIRDLQELEARKKELIEGKLPETRLNKLPFVDFAGGVATMLTDPTAWRDDWANIQPGNSVVYAAIANRDSAAADGDALALSRLARLIDALAPVSTPNAQMTPELLARVPSSIPPSPVDGVIFLFTIKAADLRITKTAAPAQITLGDNITYTLTLTNTGPAAAQNVTVTDPVPANTTLVSAEVVSGSGWSTTVPTTGVNRDIVFSKASVAADESATFRIIVQSQRVAAAAVARIVNTATVAAVTGDPNTANNSATIETPVVQQTADLRIAKTVVPLQFGANTGNLIYTLTVSNQGPGDAVNVVVSDDLPSSVTFASSEVVSGTGWTVNNPAGGNNRVSFTKPTMAVGENATFRIVVRINPLAAPLPTISNTARVDSSTSDPDATNNTSTATSTFAQPRTADLAITKTPNATTITSGGTVTYTIGLTNRGPNEASDVRVTDELPAKEFFVSARVVSGTGWTTAAPPATGAPGGTVVFSKASVALNESATFEIVVREHGSVGSIDNRVTVESSTTDPVASNNAAVAVVVVVQPQIRKRDLLVFASVDGARHFPDASSRPTPVTFTNNIPDGTTLDDALRAANIRGSVSGVTLASIAATEPTMPSRLTAVVDAVRRVGGPIGPTLSQRFTQLSPEDTDSLARNRISLTNIDEVIFIEIVIPG